MISWKIYVNNWTDHVLYLKEQSSINAVDCYSHERRIEARKFEYFPADFYTDRNRCSGLSSQIVIFHGEKEIEDTLPPEIFTKYVGLFFQFENQNLVIYGVPLSIWDLFWFSRLSFRGREFHNRPRVPVKRTRFRPITTQSADTIAGEDGSAQGTEKFDPHGKETCLSLGKKPKKMEDGGSSLLNRLTPTNNVADNIDDEVCTKISLASQPNCLERMKAKVSNSVGSNVSDQILAGEIRKIDSSEASSSASNLEGEIRKISSSEGPSSPTNLEGEICKIDSSETPSSPTNLEGEIRKIDCSEASSSAINSEGRGRWLERNFKSKNRSQSRSGL